MKSHHHAKTLLIALPAIVISGILICEAKEFRNLMKLRLDAVAGLLPTSKDMIMSEILRRQSQDEYLKDFTFSFDNDFTVGKNLSSSEHVVSVAYIEFDLADSFDGPIPCHLTEKLAVRERYLWMFVPFVNADDAAPHLFSFACFTDSDKQVLLPFVGDNVYRIDSMALDEGVLTLRNGSDEMVIHMTFELDCDPAIDKTKTMWHNIRESPLFSLSGPLKWQICDILDLNFGLCEVARENSGEISRANGNFCFLLDNVGSSMRCDATLEITKLTGIFREKSLLLSGTPMKSMGSEWIRGNRRMAMITPCFK